MKKIQPQWIAELKPEVAQTIITSRLLVMQSKRLLVNSYQRRLRNGDNGQKYARRIRQLQMESDTAHHLYRSAILYWGSPQDQDYWLIAYSRMIEVGTVVAAKMRDAARTLPAVERYQVSAEVEMVEHMVSNWTVAMREQMAVASA